MYSFVYCFFMFWGAMFGGIPLSLYLMGEASVKTEPMLLIFVVVGFIVFAIGFRMMLNNFRLKHIKKAGTQTMGAFIDRACGGTMNGTPLYFIRFTFVNEEGTTVEVKTPCTYTARQSEYYEKLGRFEIKYIKNKAVITQNVDYRLLGTIERNEQEEELTPLDDGTTPRLRGYYYCEYCGNEQEHYGKCNNCGAKIPNKNFKKLN